jgi:hypothetical protein
MFFGKKRIKVRFQIIIVDLSPIPDSLIISNPASKIYPHSFSILWRRGNKLKGNTKINEVANKVVMFDNELFTVEGTVTQDKSGACKVKPINFFVNMHSIAFQTNSKTNPEVKIIGETGFDLGDLFLKKEVVEVDLLIQKVSLYLFFLHLNICLFIYHSLVYLITICKT